MASSSDLRSKLGKVKGLGSAHHGVSHWWLQRVTAVAMIPLGIWFLISLLGSMLSPSAVQVAAWFASPVNAVLTVLLAITLFTHARLGAQVVIEDYVKHPVMKYGMLLANTFFCFLMAAISILAVLKLHFLDVVSGGI